jgi:microcystin-dependent protein
MMYDGTLSEIRVFAGGFEPKGWRFCDGKTLPINQNGALFSLLGNRFGGDGRSTFALPSLVHPVEDLKYLICVEGMYPPRPG